MKPTAKPIPAMNSRPKIVFFPSGNMELPSSNLRIFLVSRLLQERGIQNTVLDPSLPDAYKRHYLETLPAGTIIYIQKVYSRFKDCDIICFGHSHVRHKDMTAETLMINPGSFRSKRGKGINYAIIKIEDAKINAELCTLK